MNNYGRHNQIGLTARPLEVHSVTSTVTSSGRFAFGGE
jgi:hypothetical protein